MAGVDRFLLAAALAASASMVSCSTAHPQFDHKHCSGLIRFSSTTSTGAILGLTNAEDAADRIDRLLAGRYAADAPGAAVLVARKGTVVLRKGYGLANLEHRIAASPQTIFRLASVSKVFTAAAILILAEKGRLGLDDPASK